MIGRDYGPLKENRDLKLKGINESNENRSLKKVGTNPMLFS